MSPTIHNTGFGVLGLPHVYSLSESPDPEHVRKVLQDPNFGGSSVTIPHKQVCRSAALLDPMKPLNAVILFAAVLLFGVDCAGGVSLSPCSFGAR